VTTGLAGKHPIRRAAVRGGARTRFRPVPRPEVVGVNAF
jgi:hypothetical protein